MTDKETFTSDKTGKRYKFETAVNYFGGLSFAREGRLTEIIEPVLEVGDWYTYDDDTRAFVYINIGQECRNIPITEIRKANKEHWKKINGEWVKL